jgi:hypothetical protein
MTGPAIIATSFLAALIVAGLWLNVRAIWKMWRGW